MYCNHILDDNNFCTLCGLELEPLCTFVNDPPSFNPPPRKSFKYSVVPNRHNLILDHIADTLNVQNYKSLVLESLNNCKFYSRISPVDKLCLVYFTILKENNYPILLCDFRRFTNSSNSKMHRRHKNSKISNILSSDEYLVNVYNRFSLLTGRQPPLLDYLEGCRTYVNTKLEVFSLAYFLKDEDLLECFEKHKIGEYCNLRQLKRAIGKIKGGKGGVKGGKGNKELINMFNDDTHNLNTNLLKILKRTEKLLNTF